MLKISAYQQVNLPERTQRPEFNRPNATISGSTTRTGFKTELNQAIDKTTDVNFSAHARARLHSRGVILSESDLQALSDAIDKAQAKGSKESLFLSDDAAYVVSVKNRTVITAFDRENLRDGVFTSIDSAVIL